MAGDTLDLTLGGGTTATPITGDEHGGIAWDATLAHLTGDVVTVGTNIYIALIDSTNVSPIGNPLSWELYTSSERGGIAWDNTITYQVGDTVTDGSKIYVALLVNTNVGVTDETTWIGSDLKGEQGGIAWDAGVDYNIGDMVHDEITSTNFWCNTSHTSGVIGGDFASDVGFWNVMTSSLLIGWMNPTIAGGNPGQPGMVTKAVVNGNIDWNEGEYAIVQEDGWYDLITGNPTILGSGIELLRGDRLRFETASNTFTLYLDGGGVSHMKGWFDPTLDDGGTNVLFDVINGSTEYILGDYVVAIEDGWYDFITGLAGDGTGINDIEVKSGDRVIYNGTAWGILPVTKSVLLGWFDPTVIGGDVLTPIIDGSLVYGDDEYFIARVEGRYDLTTGAPAVDPDGILFAAGDRVRFDATTSTFVHYPVGEEEQGGIFYKASTDYKRGDLITGDIDNGIDPIETHLYSAVVDYTSAVGGTPVDLFAELNNWIRFDSDLERGGIVWDIEVDYLVGDIATVGTTSYVALLENTAIDPKADFELNVGNWDRLATIRDMRWRGIWSSGEYYKNDVVRDSGWTMIANKTTIDRAAPQNVGSTERDTENASLLEVVGTPIITSVTHLYTFTKNGYLNDVLLKTPDFDENTYVKIVIEYSNGNSLGMSNIILIPNQWSPLRLTPHLVSAGEQVKVTYYFYNTGTIDEIFGSWLTVLGVGSPAVGSVILDDGLAPTSITYSNIDLDGADRTAEIQAVTVNSIINIEESADISRFVQAIVTGINTGIAGETTFTVDVINIGKDIRSNKNSRNTFNSSFTVNNDYYEEENYYPANAPSFATVESELALEGTAQGIVGSAFGIDIEFQEVVKSDDWDVVSIDSNSAVDDTAILERGGILWDVSTEYKAGDIITDDLNSLQYYAVRDNIGVQPSNDNIASDWSIVGALERGGIEWAAVIDYKTGDIVTEEKYVYLATRDHTSVLGDNIDGSPSTELQTAWRATTASSGSAGLYNFEYRWNTPVEPLPPETRISTNNTDPALTTVLYMNKIILGGEDYSLFLTHISEGDWLNLHDRENTGEYVAFDVTGPAVLVGDIFEVPVAYHSHVGAFVNNQRIGIFWKEISVDTPEFIRDWETNDTYLAGEYVRYVPGGGALYRCTTEHTATANFETDMNVAMLWEPLSGYLHSGRRSDQGGLQKQWIQEQTMYVTEYDIGTRLAIVPNPPGDITPPLDMSKSDTWRVGSVANSTDITLGQGTPTKYNWLSTGYNVGDWIALYNSSHIFQHYAQIQSFKTATAVPNDVAVFSGANCLDIFLKPIIPLVLVGTSDWFSNPGGELGAPTADYYSVTITNVTPDGDGYIIEFDESIDGTGTQPAWQVGEAILPFANTSGSVYFTVESIVSANSVRMDPLWSEPNEYVPAIGEEVTASQVMATVPAVENKIPRTPTDDDEIVPKWYIDGLIIAPNSETFSAPAIGASEWRTIATLSAGEVGSSTIKYAYRFGADEAEQGVGEINLLNTNESSRFISAENNGGMFTAVKVTKNGDEYHVLLKVNTARAAGAGFAVSILSTGTISDTIDSYVPVNLTPDAGGVEYAYKSFIALSGTIIDNQSDLLAAVGRTVEIISTRNSDGLENWWAAVNANNYIQAETNNSNAILVEIQPGTVAGWVRLGEPGSTTLRLGSARPDSVKINLCWSTGGDLDGNVRFNGIGRLEMRRGTGQITYINMLRSDVTSGLSFQCDSIAFTTKMIVK